MMQRRANGGFTLIEVMIAIVIIGILATIAVPSYQGYILKSQTAALIERIDGMRTKMGAQHALGDDRMLQTYAGSFGSVPDYMESYGMKGDFTSPYPGVVSFYMVGANDYPGLRGNGGVRPYFGLFATSPEALKYLQAFADVFPQDLRAWEVKNTILVVPLLDSGMAAVKAPDPVVQKPDPVVQKPDPVVQTPDPVVQNPVVNNLVDSGTSSSSTGSSSSTSSSTSTHVAPATNEHHSCAHGNSCNAPGHQGNQHHGGNK